MNIRIYGGSDELLSSAESIITELEKKISVTDSGSEIYQLNNDKSFSVSSDTLDIIQKAVNYCYLTSGSMDITVYPLVKKWGFTTGEYNVPDSNEISFLLNFVDYRRIIINGNIIKLPENAEIDLGCIAKGYAADKVAEYLKGEGVTSALLDLGGNIQTIGTKPGNDKWKITVKSPIGEGFIGTLEVSDLAVVTSGGYERYFEQDGKKYWHILDPETGYPASSGILSATVISSSGTYCDCLSTALFVMGKDKSIDLYKRRKDFDMILVTANNEVLITPGIVDSFKLSDGYNQFEIIGN